MMTAVSVGLAASTLFGMAVVISFILGWANKAFHVEVDPRVLRINDVLPAANCAGCGYVGCNDYAEAVASGEASVSLCAPGGPSCAEAVAARIMHAGRSCVQYCLELFVIAGGFLNLCEADFS